MQPVQKKAQKSSTTDYNLLFTRIETELLQNGDGEWRAWTRAIISRCFPICCATSSLSSTAETGGRPKIRSTPCCRLCTPC